VSGENAPVQPTDTAQTLVREALRLERLDRIGDAIAAYQRALARSPDLPDAWYNLGLLQRKARQYEAALASYQQALARGVSCPEQVHLNCAVIYADCLRQDGAAAEALGCALAANPNYIPALLNLGNLHEDLGRREAAIAAYERVLALDPFCFLALARYAGLRREVASDDPLVLRLRRALAHPRATDADRASLGFALGRLLDAAGAYGDAFDAYVAANRASRASAAAGTGRYDRLEHERLIDRIIAAFPGPLPAAVQAAVGPEPIFICGMFRSGSTLTEQLLAGHPLVTAGGELDWLRHCASADLAPFPEAARSASGERLAALGAEYRAHLARLFAVARYVTDKRPDNFLYIGLIKALLPNAKIVHTMRAPLDNCLSIYFLHLDHSMGYALDLMDIGHYFRQYRRLMRHWQGLYGADILDFSYDTLVREPRAATERLLGFLGLDWDERCLEPDRRAGAVKTASVWQVREPLYQHACGRARHYADRLGKLREYLGEPQ
jgi:tetratricopeptide (TPR) repeat protein